MTKQFGFTLIELMVVVAIIAILSAIALPSYSDYVMRGRIPDATSNLAAKRVQQEQYFQDNHQYVAGVAGCANDTTTSQYFDFSCANVSATTFTLSAVGKGPMAGFAYSVTENNARSSVVPAAWGGTVGCWVTKKGGVC